ncbi:MAG: hypothetical protein OIF34_02885, partial [Porticoccaceae bacterium]|nr:hypothetical protein [Porticoccaceae bacterium]
MYNYPKPILDKIQSGQVTRAQTLHLALYQPIYLTDAGHDISHNGNTYYATGLVQGIGKTSRDIDSKVGEVTISFSMADPAVVAAIYGSDYHKRRVTYGSAILDPQGRVIHWRQIWHGYISHANTDTGLDNPTLNLVVAS